MRLVPIKFVLALLVVVAGGGGDDGCGCAWEAYRYNNYFLIHMYYLQTRYLFHVVGVWPAIEFRGFTIFDFVLLSFLLWFDLHSAHII